MQANPLSFLSTTSSSGKSGSTAASSPASDAFARLLQSQTQATQARNSMGQRSSANQAAPDRASAQSSSSATQSQQSRAGKSQNGQAAEQNSSSARADARPTSRGSRAADADRSHASADSSAANASNNSQPNAAASSSANGAGAGAGAGADARQGTADAATSGQAGNPALAQDSDAAAQITTPLNPLVLQIQQLTERSRLLADTVVALRTHPEQLPAQADELVLALSEPGAIGEASAALPPSGTAATAADAALNAANLSELAALAANASQAGAQALANEVPGSETGSAQARAGATLPANLLNPALAADPTLAADAAGTATTSTSATPGLGQAGTQAAGLEAASLQALAAADARNSLAATPDTRVSDAIQAAAAGLNPGAAPVATAGTTGLTALTGTVAAPLGAPQWGQHLSQQVVRLGTGGPDGMRHIELRLDPPDLGPVRISLSLAGEQASAIFVSPHAAVRQALEQALPQLQQAMADAGIQLGHTSVGEQDQPRDETLAQGRSGGGQGGEAVEETATVAVRTTAPRGLIDTFA